MGAKSLAESWAAKLDSDPTYFDPAKMLGKSLANKPASARGQA